MQRMSVRFRDFSLVSCDKAILKRGSRWFVLQADAAVEHSVEAVLEQSLRATLLAYSALRESVGGTLELDPRACSIPEHSQREIEESVNLAVVRVSEERKHRRCEHLAIFTGKLCWTFLDTAGLVIASSVNLLGVWSSTPKSSS